MPEYLLDYFTTTPSQIFSSSSSINHFITYVTMTSPKGIYISYLFMYVTRVEAGSNTSTVNLRVVRGDEMGLKKAAPGFETVSVMWDFVVDRVALG
jgi:membrane-bound metal-dependent hydrolase YbcI (DUF457 family)